MAGNIQNVNLAKYKAEVDAYDSLANKLHNSITDMCKELKNFKTCWSGKRINKVITLWNDNEKLIDDQVFYFGMKIHLILLEIYNQYNSMEKGAPKDSGYGWGWGGIFKVDLTDESTIKFSQDRAIAIVKNIRAQVDNANAYLKQLVNKLDSMQAYSDSLKTLSTTYKSNATKLQTSLTKICNAIVAEAEKALNDVKITEQYNEKDAKRAATTSKK